MVTSLLSGIGPGVNVTPSLGLVALQLKRTAGDIRSLREPIEEAIDSIVRPRIEQNFITESEAGIRDWVSLSSRTEKEREAQGYGGQSPKLQRRGVLKREALQKNIWTFRGSEGIAFISAGSFQRARYALTLHDGGFTPRGGKILPRPFLVINEVDEQKIALHIREWVHERFRRNLSLGLPITVSSRLISRDLV